MSGHFSSKGHKPLPTTGPLIAAVGNHKVPGPAFESLSPPTAGYSCLQCQHLAQKRRTAIDHQHEKHNVVKASANSSNLWKECVVQVIRQHPLLLMQVTPPLSISASTWLEAFFPAPAAWGVSQVDLHHASSYDRETFHYGNRFSDEVDTQAALQLRRRLLSACARDGRYDQLALSVLESATTRFCTEKTQDARLSWTKYGSHGVISAIAKRKYAMELSRYLKFAVLEHGLILPEVAGPTDHAAVDEAISALFGCMLAPVNLTAGHGWGYHSIGEYLLVRHWNQGQAQHLNPAAMTTCIAALKFTIFVLVASVWAMNVQGLGLAPVRATSAVVGASLVVATPKVDAGSLAIVALTKSYREFFWTDCFVNKRLSYVMRAAKRLIASEFSATAAVRYLNSERTEVSQGPVDLSWVSLSNLIARVKEQAWLDLTDLLSGFVFTPEHKGLLVSAFRDKDIQDNTIKDGWDHVLMRTASSPLKRLWHQLEQHLKSTYLLKDATSCKDPKWGEFLLSAENLQSRLFLLLLTSCGPPKRGAEITMFRLRRIGAEIWSNRSTFVLQETLCFADSYSKTSKASGVGKATFHFAPVDISIIFLIYLSVVRPMERKAAMHRYAEDKNKVLSAENIGKTYSEWLFVRDGLQTPVARLNLEFANQTQALCHNRMGVRCYRQLAIALGNAAFRGRTTIRSNLYFAQLCGHSQNTHDTKYAVPVERTQAFDVTEMIEVCGLWHRLVGCMDLLLPRRDAVLAAEHALDAPVAPDMAVVSAEMGTASLTLSSTDNGRPSVSPIDLDSLVAGRYPRWPGALSPGTALRLLAYDQVADGSLDSVCVLLSELTDGATRFLSYEQSETTALVLLQLLDRQQHVLSVLPTAGGKSVTWLLPALREQSLKLPVSTMLVVPFTALRLDIERYLKNARRNVRCWSYESKTPVQQLENLVPPPSVVIVSLEQVHQLGSFAEFLSANRKRLVRVVFDEIHVAVAHANFRPHVKSLEVFVTQNFSFVGTSATVPPELWTDLVRSWAMRPEEWRVVRAARTIRPNLAYTVQCLPSKEDADIQLLAWLGPAIDLSSPRRRRVIVFVPTCHDADQLSRFLQASFSDVVLTYHGQQDSVSRHATLEAFLKPGDDTKLVVATSGFGTGVHELSVQLVICYGGARDLSELIQASGRGGRDGTIARCVWLGWEMTKGAAPISRDDQPLLLLRQFASSDVGAACRRSTLSRFAGDRSESCLELQRTNLSMLVGICDRCELYATVPADFPFEVKELSKSCAVVATAATRDAAVPVQTMFGTLPAQADLLYTGFESDAFDFQLPAPPIQRPEPLSDLSGNATVARSTPVFKFRRESASHPDGIGVDGVDSMSVAVKRANASADAGPEPKRVAVEQLCLEDAKQPVGRLDIRTVVARQQHARSCLALVKQFVQRPVTAAADLNARCTGPGSSTACVLCRLSRRTPASHFGKMAMHAKGCIKSRLCFVCFGQHDRSNCQVDKGSVAGVCIICTLPPGPFHITSGNREANRGRNCDSWAKDALLDLAWFTFHDSDAMRSGACPANHLAGKASEFRAWLFVLSSDGIPNSIILAHWALRDYYRCVASTTR